MAEQTAGWTDDTSGRERVRQVAETLTEPTPVGEIAERAEVSRATAADELEQLASDDWVTETTVDGRQAYDLNPIRLLFDEVTDLIEEHSREELEQRLADRKAEQEKVAASYDADSLAEFRDDLAAAELSAAELRERREAIETWEAINTDLGLVKHALQLYDDITELASPRTDSPSTFV